MIVTLPQRRAGAAGASSATVIDGVEDRADGVVVLHAGRRAARASRSASSGSPGPTRSPSPTPSRRCCPSSRAELPTSVHMDVLYDRSDTIRESYRDVQFTMAADARRS